MRTLVDLDDAVASELDRIAKAEKTSRAALIRRGIALLLQERKQSDLERAFGLWTDERDGVAYQRDLRRAQPLKLPDAIIWARAMAHDQLLVARDAKGIQADQPGIRISLSPLMLTDHSTANPD